MRQARAREKERAFRGQFTWIESRYRPARLSEEDHGAARSQAIETFFKRALSHRVVDNLDTAALGELLYLGQEVALSVQYDMFRSRVFGKLCFGFSGHRTDNSRSQLLGKLNQQESNTASGSVNQRRIASFERVSAVSQVMSGHALEHQRGRGLSVNIGRHRRQPPRRNDCKLGIGPEDH